jgi:hypothetical protein
VDRDTVLVERQQDRLRFDATDTDAEDVRQ